MLKNLKQLEKLSFSIKKGEYKLRNHIPIYYQYGENLKNNHSYYKNAFTDAVHILIKISIQIHEKVFSKTWYDQIWTGTNAIYNDIMCVEQNKLSGM